MKNQIDSCRNFKEEKKLHLFYSRFETKANLLQINPWPLPAIVGDFKRNIDQYYSTIYRCCPT